LKSQQEQLRSLYNEWDKGQISKDHFEKAVTKVRVNFNNHKEIGVRLTDEFRILLHKNPQVNLSRVEKVSQFLSNLIRVCNWARPSQ
jgi:hypothetical protein